MGRSAYDFEPHGTQNLRIYLRQFQLPYPAAGSQIDQLFMLGKAPFIPSSNVNKSHQNHLLARQEKWRILESIQHLKLAKISPLPWLNLHIPPKPSNILDLQADSRYILPEKLLDLYTHSPTDIEIVASWLSLALVSATRVLHSVFPATESWGFQAGPTWEADSGLFRHSVWTPRGLSPHQTNTTSGTVVVAYQAPYILTEQDLYEFSKCRAFPPYQQVGLQLPSKYRLWAKMWDTCQVTNSKWFVLTSYTHWVFGAFSPGMRVGFISPVITYNSTVPTILEYLVYWLSSAMRLDGAFRVPQVGDEMPNPCETPSTAYDILLFGRQAVDEPVFAEYDIDMQEITELPRPPTSESFWRGKDDEPGPSASMDLEIESFGGESINSCYETKDKPPPSKGSIRTWLAGSQNAGTRLAGCQNARHRPLDEDDVQYEHNPEAELEENTFHAGLARGEWMISS